MENIITIEELPAFIDEAIAKVNEGVALARRRGILAELPKDVQFDVLLVSKWQDPNHKAVSTEKTSDTGESQTVQSGTSYRASKENSEGESRSADQSNSAGQNATYTYSDS
mgnify:CR=1 FL=1|jgi:hypothetical protein